MFRRSRAVAIFTLLLILVFSNVATLAQNTNSAPRSTGLKPHTKIDRNDDQEVTLPDDMRVKMAIAREENEYKKVLEDVEKLSGLSIEISKTYVERKQLSLDDLKKLNTVEKLAKRILNHAGGEEVADKSASAEHFQLGDAIDKLSTAAATIKRDMTSETRFVVSATVIANSNEVISLARLIRHTQKAD
jgi:hypothetical protein